MKEVVKIDVDFLFIFHEDIDIDVKNVGNNLENQHSYKVVGEIIKICKRLKVVID